MTHTALDESNTRRPTVMTREAKRIGFQRPTSPAPVHTVPDDEEMGVEIPPNYATQEWSWLPNDSFAITIGNRSSAPNSHECQRIKNHETAATPQNTPCSLYMQYYTTFLATMTVVRQIGPLNILLCDNVRTASLSPGQRNDNVINFLYKTMSYMRHQSGKTEYKHTCVRNKLYLL